MRNSYEKNIAYTKQYCEQIRADAIAQMLMPYDAESIEELIDNSRAKARAGAIEEYRKEMQDMIEGNEEFTDWQKHEILECNELVAETLKEQSNE